MNYQDEALCVVINCDSNLQNLGSLNITKKTRQIILKISGSSDQM